MSGASCTEQKLEGVWCHSLHHTAISSLLQEYQSLLQGLIGPQGGTLLVQHIGGLDTFVNSSSDLVKRLQPHHPCLKFIQCLMAAQEAAYGCCGLYVGILCTTLLRGLLEAELPVRVVRDVSAALMEHLLEQLQDEPQNYVTKLNISQLDQILAFVGTSIGSKNLGLSAAEKDHLKVKLVEAFLATVPPQENYGDGTFGAVTITTVDGRPATEARIVAGLLYRDIDPNDKLINKIRQRLNENKRVAAHTQNTKYSSLGNYKNQAVKVTSDNEERQTSMRKCISAGTSGRQSRIHAMSKYMRNNLQEEEANLVPNGKIHHNINLKVILFNVPLAFEKSDTESMKFTGGLSNKEYYNSVVLSKLRQLVACTKIDVIACQKVVSDVIKFELERDGVLVLERLGTVLTDSLRKLSGCSVISDVTGLLDAAECCDSRLNDVDGTVETKSNYYMDSVVGQLSDISLVEINGKMYLQLNNEHDPACSSTLRDYDHQQQVVPGVDRQRDGCRRAGGTEGDGGRGSSVTEDEETLDEDICEAAADDYKGSQVITLLLPAMSSLTAENLKVLVEEALRGLQHVALQPLVLPGGGCVEAGFAAACATAAVGCSTTAGDGESIAASTDRATADETGFTAVAPTTEAEAATIAIDRLVLGTDGMRRTGSCDPTGPAFEVQQWARDLEASPSQIKQVCSVVSRVFANLSVLLGRGPGGGNGSPSSTLHLGFHSTSGHLFHLPPPHVSSTVTSAGIERCSCGAFELLSSGRRASWPTHLTPLRNLYEINFGSLGQTSDENKDGSDPSLQECCSVGHFTDLSLNGAAASNIPSVLEKNAIPNSISSTAMNKGTAAASLFEDSLSCSTLKTTTPQWQSSLLQASAPCVTAPQCQSSLPQASAPCVTAPQCQSSLPQASAPCVTAPHCQSLLSQSPQTPVFTVQQHTLIDSYHGKLNALRLAFEGVSQLLDVDYCVFDR